jgi:hypothetical protein
MGEAMTTFKTAVDVLTEAVKDPKNKEKLAALKSHPKLEDAMKGMTQADMITFNKVAKVGRIIKCTGE